MREMSLSGRLTYYGVVPVAVGLLMAKIGPFDTYGDLDPTQRLAYWVPICVLGWLQVDVVACLLSRRMPAAWPAFVPWIVAGVLAAIPATVEVYALEAQFRSPKQFSLCGHLYPTVALLTVAFSVLAHLFSRELELAAVPARVAVRDETTTRPMEMPAAHAFTALPAVTPISVGHIPGDKTAAPISNGAPASDTVVAPFMRRIPPHLGSELLCLEMEDHYLRIYTAAGSDIILCRMRDAVEELQGAEGAQVHRSYWVARAAVSEVVRDQDRPVLVLSNGLRVPVSRTYQRPLRAAGWI